MITGWVLRSGLDCPITSLTRYSHTTPFRNTIVWANIINIADWVQERVQGSVVWLFGCWSIIPHVDVALLSDAERLRNEHYFVGERQWIVIQPFLALPSDLPNFFLEWIKLIILCMYVFILLFLLFLSSLKYIIRHLCIHLFESLNVAKSHHSVLTCPDLDHRYKVQSGHIWSPRLLCFSFMTPNHQVV